MTGSLKNRTTRKATLAVVKRPPPGGDYVWAGKDEDATRAELRSGIEQARKRERPVGSNKVSTTVRFDRDVLNAFRAGGPGWQTRMNAALREWLGKLKG